MSRSHGRRDPLSRFGKLPMDSEACLRCGKPDILRGFAVQGDLEFYAQSVAHFAGLTVAEMRRVGAMIWESKGLEPEEHLPTPVLVPLCRGCARLTDAPVFSTADLSSDREVRVFVQEEDE